MLVVEGGLDYALSKMENTPQMAPIVEPSPPAPPGIPPQMEPFPAAPLAPPPPETRKSPATLALTMSIVLAAVVATMVASKYLTTKPGSVGGTGTTAVHQQKPTYYSPAEIVALNTAIDTANSPAQLETSLNMLMSKEPTDDGPLGNRAPTVILTAAGLKTANPGYKYVGQYSFPTAVQLAQTKAALHVFVAEYTRYPLQISIGFFGSLLFGVNTRIDAGVDSQKIGGEAKRDILYSIDTLGNSASDATVLYAHRDVNHEAWHAHDFQQLFDSIYQAAFADDGKKLEANTIGPAMLAQLSDPWIALNPAGAKAYTKSTYSDSRGSDYDEHPKAGFVTGYARRDDFEDRAETFSYLMAEKKTLVLQWAAGDSVLQKKIDYLKQNLASFGMDAQTALFDR